MSNAGGDARATRSLPWLITYAACSPKDETGGKELKKMEIRSSLGERTLCGGPRHEVDAAMDDYFLFPRVFHCFFERCLGTNSVAEVLFCWWILFSECWQRVHSSARWKLSVRSVPNRSKTGTERIWRSDIPDGWQVFHRRETSV